MNKDDLRFLWRWFKGWAIGSAVAIVILTAPCKAHAVFSLGSAWINEGTSSGHVAPAGAVTYGYTSSFTGGFRFMLAPLIY